MSNESITHLVAAGCAVLALVAFVALILVPAWRSYSRLWERVAASFLSLYVLAGFVLLGVGGGAAVAWFWGEITG